MSEERGPVRIPHDVFRGLDTVRRRGPTDQMDITEVQLWLNEMGYHTAAEWLRDHREEYLRGLVHGFEPR